MQRRSPLLRLQRDDRLVAMIRAGQDRAFEALFDRYQPRLLAFCNGMLGSANDAEDVLQEVFVNAHAAMLADNRQVHLRPWLYQIARNRCLNHMRRPVAESQDSMDVHAHNGGTTTAEQVQMREDFRALVADVRELPETQRSALLLREIEGFAYEEIAQAMNTTVPAVKSLLVRARMALAESNQARHLTCSEVQVELAEAAEGLARATGPVRRHLRRCNRCTSFRSELRESGRSLASFGAVGGIGGLLSGTFAAKAVASLATAALITAGTVEVRELTRGHEDAARRGTAKAAPALALPDKGIVTPLGAVRIKLPGGEELVPSAKGNRDDWGTLQARKANGRATHGREGKQRADTAPPPAAPTEGAEPTPTAPPPSEPAPTTTPPPESPTGASGGTSTGGTTGSGTGTTDSGTGTTDSGTGTTGGGTGTGTSSGTSSTGSASTTQSTSVSSQELASSP